MVGSTHNNVTFEIFSLAYDATTRRQYISNTPDLGSVFGHIQDITQMLQQFQPGSNEIDKGVRFKIFIVSTPAIDAYVKEGLFIRLKKYKNKYTHAWVNMPDDNRDIEFEISKINKTDYLGHGLVLSLTDKQSVS